MEKYFLQKRVSEPFFKRSENMIVHRKVMVYQEFIPV